MKISVIKYQIEKIKNNSINDILKKGCIPTNNEIYKKINTFFKYNTPGIPLFKPKIIESYSVSNKISYNTMYNNLYKDFKLLYDINNKQISKLLVTEENYNVEKDKLKADINKLSLRCDNIIDSLNLNKNCQTSVLNFDNFYDIDFIGDDKRNIPKTTAYIDLMDKKISNLKISQASDKINLETNNIDVNIIGNYIASKAFGNSNNMLNDFENEIYVVKAISNRNNKLTLDISIELKTEKEFNTLVFKYTSLNDVNVLLRLSKDNKNYIEYNDQISKNHTEWNFSNVKAKYINIIITKNQADGKDINYEYYFILNNISLFKEKYEQKGLLVTNPVKLNNIINSVMFKANNDIYPSTKINYFVGIDNFKSKIDWIHVKNNERINVNLLTYKRQIINNKTKSFGEKCSNNDLYKLTKINKFINNNTIKLYFGFNMWKVEEFTSNNIIDENYIPSYKDYILKNKINSYYIDNNLYNIKTKYNRIVFLSQYIYCDKEMYCDDLYIKCNENLALKSVIYLNNNKINTNNNMFSVYLKKGKNKISIAIAIQDTLIEDVILKHNINFINKNTITCAEKKMKEIDIYNLKYNTYKNNINYYSIDNNNIIVKHNPKSTMLTKTNYIEGIRYLCTYSYLANNKKHLVVQNGDIINIHLRVMAQLTSNLPEFSPKISDIRMIGV